MKLASLYTPSAHSIPDNGLYEYFQRYFHEGLRDPEERDPAKETIEADEYQYKINDVEREFYEKFYVPQGEILQAEDQRILNELLGSNPNTSRYGAHVKDLLDFIDIPKSLGLLIAPIGWGKTVLNRYVWLYCVGRNKELRRRVIPIYISIDHNKNVFQSCKTIDEIRETFYREVLHERLVDVARPFTHLDNEHFWSFLLRGTDQYNTLEQFEEDINLRFADDNEKRKSLILSERQKTRSTEAFYPTALKYIRSCKGKVPILILDNIDTLPIEVNQIILEETIFLSQEYHFKILVSMRTQTYSKIVDTHDSSPRAYPPAIIRLEKPDVETYLRYRTASIKQKIHEAKPEFSYTNYQGNFRITFVDSLKVYDAMLEMLLGDASTNVLSYIANHNLRRVNSLVLKYLATGFIDEDRLVRKILETQTINEKYPRVPLWILLASVITNNHKTRFSEIEMPYQEGVLNVYCNGRQYTQEYLIRIHVLNYVARHRTVIVKDIIAVYSSLYTARDCAASIRYALFRLSSFGLVESPDYYKALHPEEITETRSFVITETGNYYRQEFRNFYEYLVYMKDDVELVDNPYGIQDCIKATDIQGRLCDVLKFLSMIFTVEKDFLSKLNRAQRLSFRDNFSTPEDSNLLVSVAPITSMVNFCKVRLEESNIELLHEFESLLREVHEYGENFNKTVSKSSHNNLAAR